METFFARGNRPKLLDRNELRKTGFDKRRNKVQNTSRHKYLEVFCTNE